MEKCLKKNILKSYNIVYNGDSYSYEKCKKCGLVITKPSISVNIDTYNTGHYRVKSYFIIPMLINFFDYLYIYVILLRKSITPKSYILDFGCGKGFFLYFLKLFKNKNLYGIETANTRAEYASNLTKLNISREYYLTGKINDLKYDCITLVHVLEHIAKPFDLLNALINDCLNKNGVIFIEVPNINSISSKIGGNVWAHFTPHFHINHFTSKSLRYHCELNNIQYEYVGSFSFYHGVMGMTSSLLSIFGYKGSLFEDLKNKVPLAIISFLLLLPFSLIFEFLCAFILKKGSVIKCVIQKNVDK